MDQFRPLIRLTKAAHVNRPTLHEGSMPICSRSLVPGVQAAMPSGDTAVLERFCESSVRPPGCRRRPAGFWSIIVEQMHDLAFRNEA